MPSKGTLEALFERLGYDPNKMSNFFLDSENADAQKTTDAIMTAIGQKNTVDLEKHIATLESNTGYMEQATSLQFILFAKGVLA